MGHTTAHAHCQVSPSISFQHTPRTSPERVAVSANIHIASLVVG